jgi:hypothetical protein
MEREESRPLDARLEQVTASLKASLDEVCAKDVQRLDTSESVRVEEMLALASQAAKEVVSLRRRRHAKTPGTDRAKAHPTSHMLADAVVAEHRLFVDERGVQWDAFAVLPAADPRGLARLPEPYQQGWLCFESAAEKRRLGPIPGAWQSATVDELRVYRDAAQVVPPRTTPEQRDTH